jgi:Thioesterase superfamily.
MGEYVEKAVQDYYGDDMAWCYGCGRKNKAGHHFRTGWLGEKTVTYCEPKKEWMAVPGFVYGGFIASFIDCHSTGTASLFHQRKNGNMPGDGTEPPRFVTASLKVDFLKPTPQHTLLKAVGWAEEVHPKKWKVFSEMYAGDQLCARGEVVAVLMPETFLEQSGISS